MSETLVNLVALTIVVLLLCVMLLRTQRAFYQAREAHWARGQMHNEALAKVDGLRLDRAKVQQVGDYVFSQWTDRHGRIYTEQVLVANPDTVDLKLNGDAKLNAQKIIKASIMAGEDVRVLPAVALHVDTGLWGRATDHLVQTFGFAKRQGVGTIAPDGYTLLDVYRAMAFDGRLAPLPQRPDEVEN